MLWMGFIHQVKIVEDEPMFDVGIFFQPEVDFLCTRGSIVLTEVHRHRRYLQTILLQDPRDLLDTYEKQIDTGSKKRLEISRVEDDIDAEK